ncbi:hypothetical protein F4860DRAFT_429778 [Xylaria cubensis]|nr:hypothetical protein F4860DRAFT_429778 [Xylaria cubensis]
MWLDCLVWLCFEALSPFSTLRGLSREVCRASVLLPRLAKLASTPSDHTHSLLEVDSFLELVLPLQLHFCF